MSEPRKKRERQGSRWWRIRAFLWSTGRESKYYPTDSVPGQKAALAEIGGIIRGHRQLILRLAEAGPGPTCVLEIPATHPPPFLKQTSTDPLCSPVIPAFLQDL